MYIETSAPRASGDFADFVSDYYYPGTTDGSCHIRFYYHMFGDHVANVTVRLSVFSSISFLLLKTVCSCSPFCGPCPVPVPNVLPETMGLGRKMPLTFLKCFLVALLSDSYCVHCHGMEIKSSLSSNLSVIRLYACPALR